MTSNGIGGQQKKNLDFATLVCYSKELWQLNWPYCLWSLSAKESPLDDFREFWHNFAGNHRGFILKRNWQVLNIMKNSMDALSNILGINGNTLGLRLDKSTQNWKRIMNGKSRNFICQLLSCSFRSRKPAGFINVQFLANKFIEKLGTSQGGSKILNIGFQHRKIGIIDKREMLNPRDGLNNCCPSSHQNVDGHHRGCIPLSHTIQIGQTGFWNSMPHA